MPARNALCAALIIASLSAAGCASKPPNVKPEAQAADTLGLAPGEAIVLSIDPLPDDSPSQVNTLSLAEVIQLTARHSAGIQAAIARVRIAQADAKQSRLLPNPVLSLALRFPDSGTTIIDAGLSADLIAVLKLKGTTGAADSRLRAASAEALVTVLDEITLAQEHYSAIQSLEASTAVLNERRELLDRLLSVAESKLRIGEGTRLDVITLQTQRVELEAEIADAKLELRDERLALARLIGQPSSQADWPVQQWTAPEDIFPDESALIQAALDHRPEIQQRQWELAALGYDKNNAAWAFLDGGEAGAEAERDGDWSVGPAASIPIPLFDMGQAQRDRAMAAIVEARHQLTSERRKVIEEVRRAFATLQGSRRNLDRVGDQLLPLQEERLKQAEAQFKAGQSDIASLLIAEHDLRASRAQMIELQRKLANARTRLERAVGGGGVLLKYSAPTTAPALPTTQRIQ